MRAYRLCVLEFLSLFPQSPVWMGTVIEDMPVPPSQALAGDPGVVFAELFQFEQLDEDGPEHVEKDSTSPTPRKSPRPNRPTSRGSEVSASLPIQLAGGAVPQALNVPIWDFKMEQPISEWSVDDPSPEGEAPQSDSVLTRRTIEVQSGAQDYESKVVESEEVEEELHASQMASVTNDAKTGITHAKTESESELERPPRTRQPLFDAQPTEPPEPLQPARQIAAPLPSPPPVRAVEFGEVPPSKREKKEVAGKNSTPVTPRQPTPVPERHAPAEPRFETSQATMPKHEPVAKVTDEADRGSPDTSGYKGQTMRFGSVLTTGQTAMVPPRNQTVFGLLMNRPAVAESREEAQEDTGAGLAEPQVDDAPTEAVRRINPEFTLYMEHESERPDLARGVTGATESIVPPSRSSLIASGSPADGQTDAIEAVWSKLDAFDLEGQATIQTATTKPLSSIDLAAPGHERVSVQVVESPAGLEVRVSTEDRDAKQHLLSGLDELVSRVRELSLGSVIEAADRCDAGHEFSGGRRHQPPPDREERRPRARKTGVAFALPPMTGSAALH